MPSEVLVQEPAHENVAKQRSGPVKVEAASSNVKASGKGTLSLAL